MIMKIYIIIKLVVLSVLVSVATKSLGQQKTAWEYSSPCEPTVYSPQVAEMIRYDQTSVNLNLGRIDLSIPLLEWKDQDFDIPISLSYNSEGFRPRNSDNYVGRDWMLNTGGVVYRCVNGIPDDIINGLEPLAAQAGAYHYVDGFLSVLNKRYFNLDRMEKEVYENPYKYTFRRDIETTISTLPGVNEKIESSADIFYFSFGKHSGKFMINYDGSVSVLGNNGCKYEVDLSGMKMFDSRKAQHTYICIKTDDGYVYTFGGNGYSSLEYTALSWTNSFAYEPQADKKRRNEVTAYHLTEIKAPNGRKLSITYRDIDNSYHEELWRLLDLDNETLAYKEKIGLQYSLSGKYTRKMYRIGALDAYLNNGVFEPLQKQYALNKTALIDCISTDIATIKFHYSPRDKHVIYTKGNSSEQRSFPFLCGAKLDSIKMHAMNCTQTAQLCYVYQLGNRMFLHQVKTTEGGVYSFSYNTYVLVDAPTPLTYNIDHWGFWRGCKQNNGIIPAMSVNTPFIQEYKIMSDDRNSTGEDYDYTLLQEVIYPTGGKSVFEYEPHRYCLIPTQNHINQFHVSLTSPVGKDSDVAGGARIRSISQYDGENKIIKKNIFTYGDAMRMGEIMYMPVYKYVATLINEKNVPLIENFSLDSDGLTDFPHPSVHIRYPEVTEHFVSPFAKDLSEPHPYKVTCFKGYINKTMKRYDDDFIFPTYTKEYPMLRPERYFFSYDDQQYNKNLLAHPTLDASLEYGKMENECYYDSNKKIVKKTEYVYSYKNLDKYNLRVYAPSPHFGLRTGLYTHIVKEPFFEYSLDKETTYDYSIPHNRIGMKKVSNIYSYNRDGYLTQDVLLKSYGDSLIIQYAYNNFRTADGFQVLPTKKIVSIGKPDGKYVLAKEQLDYAYQSDLLKTTFWYTMSASGVYDENENLVSEYCILSTDAYGNPIETVKNGGPHTVYLWTRYGQFLVARIENTTYKEVFEALGETPESLSEQYNVAPSVNLLREKLPLAKVYTYTYQWGVGGSSESLPNGKTVYYEYDARGRLIQIWRKNEDGEKEILQQNDYHIINE